MHDYRGLEPRSGIEVSKKQKVSSPLTRTDLILWEASVTVRLRARRQTAMFRILNHVSGAQSLLIHLTIL